MLNVAVLMGRLVADPELRHTPNGISVTSFTIAVDRSYVKAGADRQTDFIDVVAWRNTAEFVCKYFRKGQLAAVQGSIQTRSYTDKDGNKRKAVEIIADNVHFAEPKREGTTSSGNYSARTGNPTNDRSEQPAPAYANGDTDDFEEIPSDDDLPF
ncbi:Single-stranded DNA-binding protein A [Caprobacter fermentans]|uniref:Single-stranded DNA-binding protein n=1 Tax=Caproicibacter fermentans TaxID=2576756 RepID=A0A6N8HX50_9FIRM|nr:single-stranded DNA-binding protein [Caproicibacter fermentans]MVB10249.1 Single-stranded DNA-binding protein A [Caproicibacter fermentans]OCN02885.1 single-stranded DNA-binding protein [Clostridium sp. W14A]QNK40695.1 single-stranded DNA-binding protein [Caproicibacter fermentans]